VHGLEESKPGQGERKEGWPKGVHSNMPPRSIDEYGENNNSIATWMMGRVRVGLMPQLGRENDLGMETKYIQSN
jgi:hypothetical protein